MYAVKRTNGNDCITKIRELIYITMHFHEGQNKCSIFNYQCARFNYFCSNQTEPTCHCIPVEGFQLRKKKCTPPRGTLIKAFIQMLSARYIRMCLVVMMNGLM